MDTKEGLPVTFRDSTGKRLGTMTVPGMWHIEMSLAGKIPVGTEEIDVESAPGEVTRIIHGERDRIIQALRSAGTGKGGIFEHNTQSDAATSRYMFFPASLSVVKVPEKK